MSIKIDAIGLFVNDMKKMVEFYRDVVGLTTNWDGEDNADFGIGQTRLILHTRKALENMIGTKLDYTKDTNGTMEIVFDFDTYDEVDEEFIRLLENKAKPIMEPTTMEWGQRISYVSDPEGNLIKLSSFNILILKEENEIEKEDDFLDSIDIME